MAKYSYSSDIFTRILLPSPTIQLPIREASGTCDNFFEAIQNSEWNLNLPPGFLQIMQAPLAMIPASKQVHINRK